MCGICGIFSFAGSEIPRGAIQRMSKVLSHRGPDDEGFLETEKIHLGARRLSIIDVEGGHQPVCNEDKTVWVVFNGEIYNFLEIREWLERKGHRFKSRCDTEVLAHLYEEKGEECVNDLRGMFAFALWDSRESTLILGRDRVGKKPLYYTFFEGQLLFASELKSLIQYPGFPKRVNPEAIHFLLTFTYIPGPHTILEGVSKLPPGHLLVWRSGETRVRQYWEIPYVAQLPASTESSPRCSAERITPREEEKICARLLDLLHECVKLRLISDVPLGAFLSGGIDSSTIVGMMSRLSSAPVKTFSMGFQDPAFNELPDARISAEYFHTDHEERVVEPIDIKTLWKIVWHLDEPFADSSAIPTYLVSQIAREKVTVALSGDGGDELFAGYERYRNERAMELLSRLPLARSPFLRSLLEKLRVPGFPWYETARRLHKLFEADLLSPVQRTLLLRQHFTEEEKGSLYSPEMLEAVASKSPERILEPFLCKSGEVPFLHRLLYLDFRTYLVDDILVKVDRMSMAHSLEVRCPFLDHRLIEFVASLPPSLKLRGLKTKYILRKAMRSFLPPSTIRKKKWGFGVPFGSWLKGEFRELVTDALSEDQVEKRGLFRPEAVRRLLKFCMEKPYPNPLHVSSYQILHRIWTLLMLELWQQQFMETEWKA